MSAWYVAPEACAVTRGAAQLALARRFGRPVVRLPFNLICVRGFFRGPAASDATSALGNNTLAREEEDRRNPHVDHIPGQSAHERVWEAFRSKIHSSAEVQALLKKRLQVCDQSACL